MPIPAGAGDEPSRYMPTPLTRMDKLSAISRDEGMFAGDGPAPPFAEAFKAPLAGPAHVNGHLTPPNGTVPANPFSEISDGAIEYFVEWSPEQSTAPKPKAAASSFANVAMATPRKARQRTAVRPLLVGTLIGLVFGVPIGGAGVWLWKPAPLPVIVERMPEPVRPETAAPTATDTTAKPENDTTPKPEAHVAATPPRPVETTPPATPPVESKPATKPLASKPVAIAPPVAVAQKPAPDKPATGKPEATHDAPATKPLQKEQPKAELATVQIQSHPAGAAISVDGEARGKTPTTLQLPAGTHEVSLTRDRYAVATQTVDAPGKLDVTLKRPTATLHVESDPPGGDVTVEGKPRGKAPVDVTLEAFHHYDVQVTLLGTKPFKKRVSLKPPQMSIEAKLEVVHK
jgi:cytoskeletal protein RodZ